LKILFLEEYLKNKLKQDLIGIASQRISSDDPSHDFLHELRVLALSERIAFDEKADLDIVIPSALFHDLVTYSKDDYRSKNAPGESAELAKRILEEIREYPSDKIDRVQNAIQSCSYTRGIVPNLLEARILQDADGLEATGAISIMRTFSSTGSMKRIFYNPTDPFCRDRNPDDLRYALDLFYTRLLKVKGRMNTALGKRIAARRTNFLKKFLDQLEMELNEQ